MQTITSKAFDVARIALRISELEGLKFEEAFAKAERTLLMHSPDTLTKESVLRELYDHCFDVACESAVEGKFAEAADDRPSRHIELSRGATRAASTCKSILKYCEEISVDTSEWRKRALDPDRKYAW